LHLPRSRAHQILFLGIYFVFCAILVSFGAKLFWRFQAGVPFDEAAFVWDFYFPEIRRSRVKEIRPRHNDPDFDVLLLGGSVLEPGWGRVDNREKGKGETRDARSADSIQQALRERPLAQNPKESSVVGVE
jgi:hypothetical protein